VTNGGNNCNCSGISKGLGCSTTIGRSKYNYVVINILIEMSVNREELLKLYNNGPDAVIAVIENMDARIVELEAQIAELKSLLDQNSRNSSRPPSTDVFIKPKSLRRKGERSVSGDLLMAKQRSGHWAGIWILPGGPPNIHKTLCAWAGRLQLKPDSLQPRFMLFQGR
jgi:hypothetical protein